MGWGSFSGCGNCPVGLDLTLSPLSLQSNKVPVVQHPHHVHPLTPLITYSNEHFTPGNPPPHLPADVDPKTGGLASGFGVRRFRAEGEGAAVGRDSLWGGV